MAGWRRFVLVLLPFAAGYYLSYVFRSINALIAGELTYELGLGPADLGLLTAVCFFAMAAVQVPLGILLDRYGPRRVQSACLLVAAVGAGVFAWGEDMPGLLLGRTLIGLGIGTAFMASLKAVVLWYPKERIAVANGWVMMLGALGAVTATLPAEPLVAALGWRGLFALLAVATAMCAIAMFIVVPETTAGTSPRSSPVKLARIYGDARFLRIAPLSTLCIGTAWAMQGLWTAAWLEHVEGLDRSDCVRHLLIMGMALSVGAFLLGWSADYLRKHGLARETFLAAVAVVFIAAQVALTMRAPVPIWMPWAVIGAFGAATVLSYAVLSEYFPKEMSARVNAALNILHLVGAFLVQYLTGLVVSLWPPEAGNPPAAAYQVAVGLGVILQSGALLWFLVAESFARAPVFRAGRSPMRPCPAPTCARTADYSKAQLAFAHHLTLARAQTVHWRHLGMASAALCLCLSVTLGITARTQVLAHVVDQPAIEMSADAGGSEPSLTWMIANSHNTCGAFQALVKPVMRPLAEEAADCQVSPGPSGAQAR